MVEGWYPMVEGWYPLLTPNLYAVLRHTETAWGGFKQLLQKRLNSHR